MCGDASFQLTPSRRATFFLTHSFSFYSISTHALTEGDPDHLPESSSFLIFQLTPSRRATLTHYALYPLRLFQLTPSRRATTLFRKGLLQKRISTHALTEGDAGNGECLFYVIYFNSRPHGGRLCRITLRSCECQFQLTPSRRATPAAALPLLRYHRFQLTPSRRATTEKLNCLS